jgi:hypothetical protein
VEIVSFSRYAWSIGATAALLAGCGSQLPFAPQATPLSQSHDRIFHFTGAEQSFKVPTGVKQLTIAAYGAEGARGNLYPSGASASGGAGATVKATIPVTPGERLAIFVGGDGVHGGFNGGGRITDESCSNRCASFGGGASDVRQGGDKLADRVIVAGGGGGGASGGCLEGSCSTAGGTGGAGGGRKGDPGEGGTGMLDGGGGNGGAQKAGGSGGAGGGGSDCGGVNGSLGGGGAAGPDGHGCGTNGGGGGGGYYGGGGGGAGGPANSPYAGGAGGGGGGGSSFAETSAKRVKMTANMNRHDGSIVIVW